MTARLSHPSDLVVAPATVPGSGARAIVRLSGEGLARLLGEMLVAVSPGGFGAPWPARCVAARLGGSLAAEWGPLAIDVLWWPGPAGPTGGPLAELQLPACAPLVDAVVAAALRHGARLARGGEFTLRSFLAGRLDLVQAEAVLAVVEAGTPEELSLALDRMAGGAGRRLRTVRESLLDLCADVEAVIDFSDERSPDHVAADGAAFRGDVAARLRAASGAIDEIISRLGARDAAAGELPRVAVFGRPNIGKSSLFNALVGGPAALVADEIGTTRDWIGARLEGGGTACQLVDLAGVAEQAGGDPLAAAAGAVAAAEAARADVIVVCRDAAAAADAFEVPGGGVRIDVATRCDLVPSAAMPEGVHLTSARDGRGIDGLRQAILESVRGLSRAGAATLRMREGIETARAAIEAAAAEVRGAGCDEAVAAGLIGRAVEALGAVTGLDLATDLIDRIFQRHCVGK